MVKPPLLCCPQVIRNRKLWRDSCFHCLNGYALGNPLQVVGEAPIRFIIRGKRYFHFLEPVILEFKLKNSSQDVGLALPMELDTELNPQYGSVMLHIQRPNGRILAYEPAMHILREPRLKQLHPGPQGRYCQNVLVSFGKYGHYFDEPGLYRVRGLYRGLNNMLVASNVHELRVGRPFSRDEERDAQDFYSWAAGMALYLGGSDSPYLRSGMDCLRRVAERHEQSPVGAHLSLVLAQNLSRPFRRVVEVGREHIEVAGRLVEVVQSRREERQPDLQEALKLVDRALQQHSRDNNTFQNITCHHCSRTRANLLATIGQRDEAKNELDRLIPYLSGRGVKEDVLAEIESYKQTL